MAQHSHYWSCSPFGDWIRGTTKLKFGTSEEWDEWNEKAAGEHPIRYWIAEEGLGKVQDFVTWPSRKIRDVQNYITNRYVSKTHALTSKLKRGQWYEFETRLLHSMMDSLVDYVEIEEAWHYVAWGDKQDQYKSTSRFWWQEWRCPEAGVDYLKWAAGLVYDKDTSVEGSPNFGKPTGQAIHAQEILALYTWWTVIRPARPDPYEVSGWTAYCASIERKIGSRWFGKRTPDQKKTSSKILKVMGKIEAGYDKEDQDMMIRLIKVSARMWT